MLHVVCVCVCVCDLVLERLHEAGSSSSAMNQADTQHSLNVSHLSTQDMLAYSSVSEMISVGCRQRLNATLYSIRFKKGKDRHLYSAHSKELTAEALTCGSHSFHTTNIPYLPLLVGFHQRAPPVMIAAI